MNLIADVEIRRPTSSVTLGGPLEQQMCSLTRVICSACSQNGWEETFLPRAVEIYNQKERGITMTPLKFHQQRTNTRYLSGIRSPLDNQLELVLDAVSVLAGILPPRVKKKCESPLKLNEGV